MICRQIITIHQPKEALKRQRFKAFTKPYDVAPTGRCHQTLFFLRSRGRIFRDDACFGAKPTKSF
jgi:hypothetical protein